MADIYSATISWSRGEQDFPGNRYSRRHEWRFDGGVVVPASSSPLVVPVPLSASDAVDPEEAFVASLASCHMLFFLSFAAKAGLIIDTYTDNAIGEMGKNATGKHYVARVVLRPTLMLSGSKRPTSEEIEALHYRAHDFCFIANSVLSEIVIEPPPPVFV